MKALVDDYIAMNQQGLVLELCEKHYDENVVMFNNGAIFARSMKEAYDKQKGFIQSVEKFDVKLVSALIKGDIAELTFSYKMTGPNAQVNEFVGKHIQTWKNHKIIKQEYHTIN